MCVSHLNRFVTRNVIAKKLVLTKRTAFYVGDLVHQYHLIFPFSRIATPPPCSQFVCDRSSKNPTGKCLNLTRVCDRFPDCIDMTDESNELCNYTTTVQVTTTLLSTTGSPYGLFWNGLSLLSGPKNSLIFSLHQCFGNLSSIHSGFLIGIFGIIQSTAQSAEKSRNLFSKSIDDQCLKTYSTFCSFSIRLPSDGNSCDIDRQAIHLVSSFKWPATTSRFNVNLLAAQSRLWILDHSYWTASGTNETDPCDYPGTENCQHYSTDNHRLYW